MNAEAYSEEAFHYLLDIEQKRADRSKRSCLLLLADLNSDAHIEAEVAAKLFQALRLSLRETDFVGWYRRERIAGAVLTERKDAVESDVSTLHARLASAIDLHLPKELADRVQLEIHELPSRLKALDL